VALTAITADIWTARRSMRFPGGVSLPIQMTVVRLPSSGLLLHSPVAIDDALAAELAAIGPVMQVVAPNLLHHVHLTACLRRYPDARLYAPQGLARKRPDLRIDGLLADEAPPAWAEVMDQHLIKGAPRLDEVVFCHRRTGTLIATDLVFNVRDPQGWATRLALRSFGTLGRFAQSRLWRWWYAQDRAAVRASLAKILSWDFDRVLMAHGDPVETDARERLRAALLPALAPVIG
jgi:hypothetical protein